MSAAVSKEVIASLEDISHSLHTLEEYFVLEGVGFQHYEYWEGKIVCVSGGTWQYSTICGNLLFILHRQLKGRNCNAFLSGIPIKTPSLPPYRYSNGCVVLGEPTFERIESVDVLVNPTLITEVLSPTTENLDRGPKLQAHQALPSLFEYLVVSQAVPHITHYLRQKDDWVRSDYGGLEA